MDYYYYHLPVGRWWSITPEGLGGLRWSPQTTRRLYPLRPRSPVKSSPSLFRSHRLTVLSITFLHGTGMEYPREQVVTLCSLCLGDRRGLLLEREERGPVCRDHRTIVSIPVDA